MMILPTLRRSRALTPARSGLTPGPSATDEGGPVPAEGPGPGRSPAAPRYQRLCRWILAVAIVGGPVTYLLGGALSPSIHETGQPTMTANAAASAITNSAHLAAFVLASFLLPIGAVGLAYLAYPRAPWLATAGGLLAVAGWLPFSALTALDDFASTAAHLPGSGAYAGLWDRFSTDAVMSTYLIVYIAGHLVAYVLLGIALGRARVIPRWAAWSVIASSPLTVAVFVVPGRPLALGYVALSLLVLGSLPAASAMAPAARLTEAIPRAR